LRALISPITFEGIATIVQRLAYLVGAEKSKAEAQREAWVVLSEGVQMFNHDVDTNPLICAVREVRAEDPNLIFTIVTDTRNTVWAMGEAFPILKTASPPLADDPDDKTKKSVAKLFGPAMTAATAFTRHMPHGIELRRKMREGNFQPALAEFHQIKVITDTVAARIGIGADHE
jgi:hypothetical protein